MNINLASFFDFWRNQRRLNVTVGPKTVSHSQLLMNSVSYCLPLSPSIALRSILCSLNISFDTMYRTLLRNICLENARISGDLNWFDRSDQRFCDRWILERLSANKVHHNRWNIPNEFYSISFVRFECTMFVWFAFAIALFVFTSLYSFVNRFSFWLRVCFVYLQKRKRKQQ